MTTAEAPAAPATAPAPRDANDLRGYHMRRMLGKPWIMAVGLGTAIVVGVVVGVVAKSAAIGVAAGAVELLVDLVILFFVADSQAEDDFFRAYAGARGLAWSDDRSGLPRATSLLRKGDGRFTEMTLTGRLPNGPNGVLAHYTYEEESTDSEGHRQTSYYHFTVVLCELPKVTSMVSQLAVQRRSGFRILDSTEDRFRKRQRVEVESEAFDKRYEAFIGHDDDMNKARQIFEPTFIVWLTEQAPKGFWFELENGALCIAVKGQLENSDKLDGLCAASGTVARRLSGEASE
jgi:hypothetical protein